jgi:hypothetical protein
MINSSTSTKFIESDAVVLSIRRITSYGYSSGSGVTGVGVGCFWCCARLITMRTRQLIFCYIILTIVIECPTYDPITPLANGSVLFLAFLTYLGKNIVIRYVIRDDSSPLFISFQDLSPILFIGWNNKKI